MTYMDVIYNMQSEKELVEKLNEHLQIELDLVSAGDVQTLEDSMPIKQKLLRDIAEIREKTEVPGIDPLSEHADKMRLLQQELIILWKKASSLNELSKKFLHQRLNEINDQLEIFFSGMKDGYTRDGKKSFSALHTIKTGA